MYPRLKDVLDVTEYIPDLQENELPEEKYWHQIISTLYPKEMIKLIEEAHSNRGIINASTKDEIVELTPRIEKEISNIFLKPSK